MIFVKDSQLTVTDSNVQLDKLVNMECTVTSDQDVEASLEFCIEDTESPGSNTSNVKFSHQGNLVDCYQFDTNLVAGENNLSDDKTLMDSGLAESTLIAIKVTITATNGSDFTTTNITVHPK